MSRAMQCCAVGLQFGLQTTLGQAQLVSFQVDRIGEILAAVIGSRQRSGQAEAGELIVNYRKHFRRIAALIALTIAVSSISPSANAGSPCREITFRAIGYVVCTVDLHAYLVRLFWKDPQQQPYGGFDHLPRRIENGPLVFAMNAGMYEEDRSPVGLYVEGGKALRPVNQRSGSGNFYLKPNGILFIHGEDARIMTTERFAAERPKVEFATQSGPMLVIGGQIHSRIKSGSTSRKIRNGVGTLDSHTLVFAISKQPVTFWEFAQLFRARLGSRNALFLDGGISSLYAPALRRLDSLYPMGPIIAAYVRK
jgi:uncharacterized protein YigE (DUF2233 family)